MTNITPDVYIVGKTMTDIFSFIISKQSKKGGLYFQLVFDQPTKSKFRPNKWMMDHDNRRDKRLEVNHHQPITKE